MDIIQYTDGFALKLGIPVKIVQFGKKKLHNRVLKRNTMSTIAFETFYMNKIIYLLLISLPQCTFRINNTNDGCFDLSKDQKKDILQYSNSEQKIQPYHFVEITAEDIKNSCSQYNYTLVYQLAQWCTPCVKEFKKDFKILDSISKASTRVKGFVVNNSYGFERSIERL